MNLLNVGFVLFATAVLVTTLVWLPSRATIWFGHSFPELKKQDSEAFSKSILNAFQSAGITTEQSFYNLPPSSFLALTSDGNRILIDCNKWSESPDIRYWSSLEILRQQAQATEAWSIRPQSDGVWAHWLTTSKLDFLKTKSFSQFNHWLNTNKA